MAKSTPGNAQLVTDNRVPGSKRDRNFQRALAKARKAIEAGEISPSVLNVKNHCRVGSTVAQAIIVELVRIGVCYRTPSGRAIAVTAAA